MVSTSLLLALAASAASATTLYSTYSFDPLEHLGGVAPYFEPETPETDPSPPRGCTVTRAAYLVRHAAIYANDFDYEEYIEPFISKFQNHTNITWSQIPSLSFLSTWKPPITDAELELLTRTGSLEAAQLAVSLSFKYPNLRLPSHVWTSSAERTVKTAGAFARGIEMDANSISVISIPESKEAGANSLTPYSSCPAYSSSAGSDQAGVFQDKFTAPIVARLNASAPSFNFTSNDVYGMMELCGYESVIRGSSPFCNLDLFSPDEWLSWEYSADVMYHYNTGYGSPASPVIGLPWLNTTAGLLMDDSPANSSMSQDMYVSFTHRELPPTVLVAMGLFNNSAYSGANLPNATMPLDRINYQRVWKSSHILPFLTNIAIERMNCTGSYGYDDGDYYRALVNNAPQSLPDCADGPGTSCSADSFKQYIADRAEQYGGYSQKCGVKYGNSTDFLTIYTDPAVGNGTLIGKKHR